MFLRRLVMLAVTAALLALTGCESKFNHRNFQMIRPGADDRADVRHILGDPVSDMGDVWLYDDLDHHHSAQIFFDEDGRVLNKEWMDAKTGDWEGENPWTDRPAQPEVRERETRIRRYED
jgi:outer membrane protein assembly factor BamE (lipoprotein component of BamABCDE complex)